MEQNLHSEQHCPVVVYGAPLVGKASILQEYARRHALEERMFDVAPPDEAFGVRGYGVFSSDGILLAATISKAVWTLETWNKLLRATDNIVVVIDPQETMMDANREYLEFLESKHHRIAGIQVTKLDIVGEQRATSVAGSVAARFAPDVPVILSTIRHAASLIGLVELVTRRARDGD